MGWWSEVVNGEALLLGDEPLDAASQILDRIVLCYETEIGRKPMLAELAKTLERAMAVRLADFSDTTEDVELREVIIKLARRPKKQRANPGDVFAIPLPSGGYGYGLIKRVFRPSIVLSDFLDIHSQAILPVREVVDSSVLFEALCGHLAIAGWEWRRIGSVPVPGVTSSGSNEELEDEMRRLHRCIGPVNAVEKLDAELRNRKR